MWSTWQKGALTSQKGWVHSRSRTSMARRVAPVKNRLVGLVSTRHPGLNTARSRSAPVTRRSTPVASRDVQPMATLRRG